MDISKLTREEKYSLLSELLNDPDTVAVSEAELQNRLRKTVKRLYDEIEKVVLDYDRIRSEERRNMWTTSHEGLVARGRSEACARIKTVLDEIVEKPEMSRESYDVISVIHKRKNDIVDNTLSNSFRGRRGEYERLLRFEGRCADILESEWTWAFRLGLECKDKVSEERLAEIRGMEGRIRDDLCGGMYDRGRVVREALEDVYGDKKTRCRRFLEEILPRDPTREDYGDIMETVTEYIKDVKE